MNNNYTTEERKDSKKNLINDFLKKLAENANNIESNEYVYNEMTFYKLTDEQKKISIIEDDIIFNVSGFIYRKDPEEKIIYDKMMSRVSKVLKEKYSPLKFNRKAQIEYFEQFTLGKLNKVNLPYKIYIPISNINGFNAQADFIIEYCHFLSKNNIVNSSKFAKPLRVDNLVSRVDSKENVEKIIEFVNNSKYIDLILDVNPFVISENKVGLAFDGSVSYNETVATFLFNYIKTREKEGALENVEINDFKKFIITDFNEKFENPETIKEHVLNNEFSIKQVIDLAKTKDLLLFSLEDNIGKNRYFSVYDYVNGPEKKVYYNNLYNQYEQIYIEETNKEQEIKKLI